jgi:hypothetical protein
MSPVYRELVRWARTVHLYLTLFALALVLFFSVTGFMLNHEDWFVPPTSFDRTHAGKIPTELLAEPDKLAVAELLRKDYGAVGLVDSFETEEDRLRVVFKRPGTEVEALIQRESGEAEVTVRTRGVWAVFCDLHRGKSTGAAWSFVIDATCVVLLILSATGLIMWSSLKSRGRFGLVVVAVGAALSVAVVLLFAL